MNALGLATRGYLCYAVLGQSLQAPGIVDVEATVPDIDGAKTLEVRGPQITGSSSAAPSITDADSAVEPRTDSPTISGSQEYVPVIRKKE